MMTARWMDYETPFFRLLSRALDGPASNPTPATLARDVAAEWMTCGWCERRIRGPEVFQTGAGGGALCLDCYIGGEDAA